jgi:ABC-type transporter Mla MlaB component
MAAGPGWSVEMDGTRALLVLDGDWLALSGILAPEAPRQVLATGAGSLAFDATRLGRWDTALIALVAELRDTCNDRSIACDTSGLPSPAQRLLGLAMGAAPRRPAMKLQRRQ